MILSDILIVTSELNNAESLNINFPKYKNNSYPMMICRSFNESFVVILLIKENNNSITLNLINTSDGTIHGETYENNKRYTYILKKENIKVDDDFIKMLEHCKKIDQLYFHIIEFLNGEKIKIEEDKQLDFSIFEKIRIELPKFSNCVFYSFFYARSIIEKKTFFEVKSEQIKFFLENGISPDAFYDLRLSYEFLCKFCGDEKHDLINKFNDLEMEIIKKDVEAKNKDHLFFKLSSRMSLPTPVTIGDHDFSKSGWIKKKKPLAEWLSKIDDMEEVKKLPTGSIIAPVIFYFHYQNKIIKSYQGKNFDECLQFIDVYEEYQKKLNFSQNYHYYLNHSLFEIKHVIMAKKNNLQIGELNDLNRKKYGIIHNLNEVNCMRSRKKYDNMKSSPFPMLSSHIFFKSHFYDFANEIVKEIESYAGLEKIIKDSTFDENYCKQRIKTLINNYLITDGDFSYPRTIAGGFFLSFDENFVMTHQEVEIYHIKQPELIKITDHIKPAADFFELINILQCDTNFSTTFNGLDLKNILKSPFPSMYRNLLEKDSLNEYYQQSDYDNNIQNFIDEEKINKIIRDIADNIMLLDSLNTAIFIFVIYLIEDYWKRKFHYFSELKKKFLEGVQEFEIYEAKSNICDHIAIKLISAIVSEEKKNLGIMFHYVEKFYDSMNEELTILNVYLLSRFEPGELAEIINTYDIELMIVKKDEKFYISHKEKGIEKNNFLQNITTVRYEVSENKLTVDGSDYHVQNYSCEKMNFDKIYEGDHIILKYSEGYLPADFIKNFDFVNRNGIIIGESSKYDFKLIVKDNKIYRDDSYIVNPKSVNFHGDITNYFNMTPIYFYNENEKFIEIMIGRANLKIWNNRTTINDIVVSKYENNDAFKWITQTKNIFYSHPNKLLIIVRDEVEIITVSYHGQGFSDFTNRSIELYKNNSSNNKYYYGYKMKIFNKETPKNEILRFNMGLTNFYVADGYSVTYSMNKKKFDVGDLTDDAETIVELNNYYRASLIGKDINIFEEDIKNAEKISTDKSINGYVFKHRKSEEMKHDKTYFENYGSVINSIKKSINDINCDINKIEIGKLSHKIIHRIPQIQFIKKIERIETNEINEEVKNKTSFNLCKGTKNIGEIITSDVDIVDNSKKFKIKDPSIENITTKNSTRMFLNNFFLHSQEDFLEKYFRMISADSCHVHDCDITLLYEINCGSFLRYNQYKLVKEMVKSLTTGKKKYFQMLMGSGKTKFIIPNVCLILFYYHNTKQIYVVQPSILVKQTTNIFLKYVAPLIDVKITNNVTKEENTINVISDADLKKYIVNGGETKDIIIIFDEVDELSNNLKSEMNFTDSNDEINELDFRVELISKFINFSFDYCDKHNPDYFMNDELLIKDGTKLVDEFKKMYPGDGYKDKQKFIYDKLADNIFKIIFTKKNNLNYGIDFRGITKQNKFYAIPFVSAQNPSHTSQFSDIDFCIAYTYLSYKYQINIPDYITKKFINYYEKGDEDIVVNFTQLEKKYLVNTNTKKIIEKQKNYKKKSSFSNPQTIIYFIKKIFGKGEYKYNKRAKNISFIDIFSNRYFEKKVGVTGTPFILPFPDLDSKNSVCCVKFQKGANGAIVKNIKLTYKMHKCDKNKLIESVFKVIKEQNILFFIDVAAYFVDNDIGILVEKLFNFLDKKKRIIFFKGDDVFSYNEIGINKYDTEKETTENDLFFFDNGHITGVDVKLCKGVGIASVSHNTRFRDMAQGIYRLRSLGNGQSVEMISYDDVIQGYDKDIFVNFLLTNEENTRKQMLYFYYPQLARCIDRSISDDGKFDITINSDELSPYEICENNIKNKEDETIKKILGEYKKYLENKYELSESTKENTNENTNENINEQNVEIKFELNETKKKPSGQPVLNDLVVIRQDSIYSTTVYDIYNDTDRSEIKKNNSVGDEDNSTKIKFLSNDNSFIVKFKNNVYRLTKYNIAFLINKL